MKRVFTLLAVLSVTFVQADEPTTGDPKVTVTAATDAGFPEISVDFELKQPDGSFVLDAKQADFRVTESGQEMPIVSLVAPISREAKPITVVLVVDHSGSMAEENRIGGLKRAVASFLEQLPKGSRVSVVAFSTQVRTICPFTTDFAEVDRQVQRLRPGGTTHFFDAVAEALALLEDQTGRRAVLALTDGEDQGSRLATLESVGVDARRLGLPVHTLGLGSEDLIATDALKTLANSTRGQYYPAREVDQLRRIYEEIARRLRSSYTLVYRTTNKLPDGTLRPVNVIYRAGKVEQAGTTALFIPGMVVPASGWSVLFLILIALLSALALLPGLIGRRSTSQV